MTRNSLAFIVLLSAIAIIALTFLRLFRLDQLPVFVDEAIYVRWSQVMRNEPTLRFLPLSDGKQPLFMWVTIPFLKFISDPLVAGRLVSVMSGLASSVGIIILCQLLFSNYFASTFSFLIYSILPFTVFFDRMALADSMLAAFGVWSLIFAVRFAKNLLAEDAMYLGFAIGGGLLTKSPAAIFYLWSLLAIIFFTTFSQKNVIRNLIKGIFLTLFISQGMYSILRLGVGFSMIGERNQDYVYSFLEVLRHPLSPLLGNLRSTISWFLLLVTPTMIISSLLGYFYSHARKPFFFLIISSFIPLFFQASIAKVYTSRYILYAVLPLIPLAGLGLSWLFSRKGLLIRSSTIIFLTMPTMISILYLFRPEITPMPFDMSSGYYSEWTSGVGQKDVATYLIDQAKNLPNDRQIVVFTEGTFGTLPDGLQIYTEGQKKITVVGSTPNIYEIPSGLLNTDPRNLRYYVLNASRNHLPESDLTKLELIKEYPKLTRPDGTQEKLLFFRLR